LKSYAYASPYTESINMCIGMTISLAIVVAIVGVSKSNEFKLLNRLA
jgi:hypothetical protein